MMKKMISYFSIGLNILMAIFLVYYAITFKTSVAANILGGIMVATLIWNIVYAVNSHKRAGFYYLVGFIVAMILSLAGNYLSVTPSFKTSVGWVSVVCLPLLFIGTVILHITVLTKPKDAPLEKPALFKTITAILNIAAILSLLFFSYIVISMLFGNYSFLELFIGGLLFYLALIAFACGGLLLFSINSIYNLKNRKTHRIIANAICLFLSCFTLIGLSLPIISLPADIAKANQSYTQAFGDEYLKQEKGLRSVRFSIPDFFIGTRTMGYESKTNIVYYEAEDGFGGSMKLAYDVYYPSDNNAEASRSVLIRMHGAGGDKGLGNYPMPNKYFASRGYVVYDLQYGDFYENTGIQSMSVIQDSMFYLRSFIQYAKAHNDEVHANWDSVFISGNSMGGGLASELGVHFSQGDPIYDALQITVKGIIPIYPAYYSPLINESSAPCLAFIGTHDGFVDTNIGVQLESAYHQAKNPNCAVYTAHYGCHGCDAYYYGHYMQTFAYYMERFMAQHR